MSPDGLRILESLQVVDAERRRRAADPALLACVHAVKQYQHARFERSHADLLSQPRYARAARFFLEELYGPHDFAERDAQFARVIPALVRLFSHEIVSTVRALGELHALSEVLDSALATAIAEPPDGLAASPTVARTDGCVPNPLTGSAAAFDRAAYVRAWQLVGQPEQRERQVLLMLEIGRALDVYTRKPLLRHTLRMMRLPAQAAGLGALQEFLESGFDTFREMRGAAEFLDAVAARERALCSALFAADAVAQVTSSVSTLSATALLLGQLP